MMKMSRIVSSGRYVHNMVLMYYVGVRWWERAGINNSDIGVYWFGWEVIYSSLSVIYLSRRYHLPCSSRVIFI